MTRKVTFFVAVISLLTIACQLVTIGINKSFSRGAPTRTLAPPAATRPTKPTQERRYNPAAKVTNDPTDPPVAPIRPTKLRTSQPTSQVDNITQPPPTPGASIPALSTAITPTAVSSGCPTGCTEPPLGCEVKGNVNLDTGEKIYHLPGQRLYEETIIDPESGERWFCTEEEAQANGWRKSTQ